MTHFPLFYNNPCIKIINIRTGRMNWKYGFKNFAIFKSLSGIRLFYIIMRSPSPTLVTQNNR